MTNDCANWFAQNSEFDGFFVSKTENVYYASGFWGSFGFFLCTKKDKNYLITDGRYAEKASALAAKNKFEFVLFDADFVENFGQQMSGNFACEDTCSLGEVARTQKHFPNIKFTPQPQVWETIRRRKTSDEIQQITIAQNHVDKVLIPFLKTNLKAGITEKMLNFKLQQVLQHEGEFGLSFPSIIAFGENSSRPHHVSGTRKLQLGDNILVDCGVTHNHYCSDMTRNFVFGKPHKDYLQKYQLLLTAQQKTNNKITVGESTQNIDAYCREQLGAAAAYFTHSLGHGVGLEIHELPNLSPRKDYTLQANEVVTNEPGLYYPGKFGIRIEDLLVVTPNDPLILSQTSKDLLSFDEAQQVHTLIKSEM